MDENVSKKACSLCNQKTTEFRETLYGAIICQPCHNVLMKYGFKSKEMVDKLVQDTEIKMRENLEEYRRNIPLREPCSREKRKIGKISFLIGASTFLMTWLITFITAATALKSYDVVRESPNKGLTVHDLLILASIYPAIALFLSILAGNLYFKLMERRKRKLIEEELERDKRVAEQEKERLITNEEGRLKWHLSRYSRYPKIISKATKEDILLYEYFIGEYPPDWEYRAKIVRNRDGNRCTKCGKKGVLHVHHIVPVQPHWSERRWAVWRVFHVKSPFIFEEAYGGSHYLENLITLCEDCHWGKYHYNSA